MIGLLEHRGPDGDGWLLDDGTKIVTGRQAEIRGESTQDSPGSPVGGQVTVALGHRRLAISDLSRDAAQPMSRADGRFWVTFNGAIYNAVELRRELASLGEEFVSWSDTEVLLAAMIRWGPAALHRFNGMWAFALWDAATRELFCARDRFGVKPFYYGVTREGLFAFASEPKALRPVIEAVADRRRLEKFLQCGQPAGSGARTAYSSYSALPEGSWLKAGARGFEVSRWYEFEAESAKAIGGRISFAEAALEVRSRLEDAVRIRLRSDVPVGAFLSGGIDSSALTALACRHGGSFAGRTISTHYPSQPEIDESAYIRSALEETGCRGEFVEPTIEGLERELDDFVYSLDDLPPLSVFYAQRILYRTARRFGLTVMIGGQGSDEVFGGYEPWGVYLRQLDQERRWGRLTLEAVLASCRVWGTARGLSRARGMIRRARGKEPLDDLCIGRIRLRSHLRHLLLVDYLPPILRFEDRNSMAWGVESRMPFLDHRLVEFGDRLPAEFRLRRGWTKAVLRRAVDDLLPRKIARRRTKLGLPGPLEGSRRIGPDVVKPAWERLVREGYARPDVWTESPDFAFRVRAADAWTRRCLGGEPK
jgi:asparagine synthase (glutamine-hydrolysing)